MHHESKGARVQRGAREWESPPCSSFANHYFAVDVSHQELGGGAWRHGVFICCCWGTTARGGTSARALNPRSIHLLDIQAAGIVGFVPFTSLCRAHIQSGRRHERLFNLQSLFLKSCPPTHAQLGGWAWSSSLLKMTGRLFTAGEPVRVRQRRVEVPAATHNPGHYPGHHRGTFFPVS